MDRTFPDFIVFQNRSSYDAKQKQLFWTNKYLNITWVDAAVKGLPVAPGFRGLTLWVLCSSQGGVFPFHYK